MDGMVLARLIKEKRDEIYTYLHTLCPETVRNGSVQKAVEFKKWCEDAQRMLGKSLSSNERTLSALQYLAARYNQFRSETHGESHAVDFEGRQTPHQEG